MILFVNLLYCHFVICHFVNRLLCHFVNFLLVSKFYNRDVMNEKRNLRLRCSLTDGRTDGPGPGPPDGSFPGPEDSARHAKSAYVSVSSSVHASVSVSSSVHASVSVFVRACVRVCVFVPRGLFAVLGATNVVYMTC